MLKRIVFIFGLTVLSFAASAQAVSGSAGLSGSLRGGSSGADGVALPSHRWTLDECMRYAVEHSPQVERQSLVNDNFRQDYLEAVASLFPTVSAEAYATMNYGRSIDPETNTYTNNRNLGNDYQLTAQMPVFAGLTGINTVRAARIGRLMGNEQLRQVSDETALETMRAYFDVVYYASAAELAADKLEQSRESLKRSRKMEELGLSSAADVAEFEAQVASDDYLLTQQRNRYDLALIILKQRMNYPDDSPLEVETEVYVEMDNPRVALRTAMSSALELMPALEAAHYDVRYAELKLSAERGRYWPALYVGGGYSTRYFRNYDAQITPSFANQFKGNRGYYFGATLSVPIFGGLSRRTAVHRSRNDMLIARQKEIEVERDVRSQVSQAVQELDGYGKEYVQADKKVASMQLAYRAVQSKYEQGLVSPLDLQISANRLLEARSQMLNARLQYIIRSRIVDYYCGRPLIR